MPRADHPTFGPTCAEVWIDGKCEGILGELHPEIHAAMDLRFASVYLAELRIEPLIKQSARPWRFRPISNYPAVIEDLAFVVREDVSAAAVTEAIRHGGAESLVELSLFDVYRGEHLHGRPQVAGIPRLLPEP